MLASALLPLSDTETASLSDRVYGRLRDAIIAGSLVPRARVSERMLAGVLGVSAAPVREALRRLESEGLVITLPRRGTLVADFGPEQLEKMGRIRVALEGTAAAFAARQATPEHIEALTAQLAVMREATEAGDAEALAQANERFHDMIHEIADNAFLEQMLRSLRGYDRVGRRRILAAPGELKLALQEHAALVEALRERDGEEAEARMRAHALRSLQQAFWAPFDAPGHGGKLA
ncbi:GntR family transcriptional regulator [Roseomonas elaeocarpi]|uniref:GntR family transcriptional regulator n=1 Tax=Roseomonas elaeocarpi TaxID=907779 RepID=A0ABV6JT96_9PROT